MNLSVGDGRIPGTILKKSDMSNVTGLEFLSKIFFITDGVMIAEIRRIAGLDTSTLQNWAKRGWMENSKFKRYTIDQVAHILIINMLRSCMSLDRISFLIHYINGNVNDRSDDIICASRLYDYICRILDKLTDDEGGVPSVKDCIAETIGDYEETVTGARKRLQKGLEIIVIAYYASLLKHQSDAMIDGLTGKE